MQEGIKAANISSSPPDLPTEQENIPRGGWEQNPHTHFTLNADPAWLHLNSYPMTFNPHEVTQELFTREVKQHMYNTENFSNATGL